MSTSSMSAHAMPTGPAPQFVLVVDDNRATRHSLAMLLHVHGYHVSEAADGGAALSRFSASPERLVVLVDLGIPTIDGIAFLQAVAASSDLATRHAYIVMTSATANTTIATWRTLPSQVTPLLTQLHVLVLTKPFRLSEMLQMVQEAQGRLKRGA